MKLIFGYKSSFRDNQYYARNLFGPSGVHAVPLAAGINVVAIVLGIIFLLSFFLSKVLTQNPRRVCRRVSNFCMGS